MKWNTETKFATTALLLLFICIVGALPVFENNKENMLLGEAIQNYQMHEDFIPLSDQTERRHLLLRTWLQKMRKAMTNQDSFHDVSPRKRIGSLRLKRKAGPLGVNSRYYGRRIRICVLKNQRSGRCLRYRMHGLWG